MDASVMEVLLFISAVFGVIALLLSGKSLKDVRVMKNADSALDYGARIAKTTDTQIDDISIEALRVIFELALGGDPEAKAMTLDVVRKSSIPTSISSPPMVTKAKQSDEV